MKVAFKLLPASIHIGHQFWSCVYVDSCRRLFGFVGKENDGLEKEGEI